MPSSAYFAGLFDGEGCIIIGSNAAKTNYYLQSRVAMTDIEPLIALQEKYGGALKSYDSRPYRQPLSMWVVTARGSEAFLNDVLPYLMVKKRQAKLALRFLRECRGKQGKPLTVTLSSRREKYKLRLSKLKVA